MGLAIRKIKVYSKLTLIGVVTASLLVIGFKNRANKADVWLFREYADIPTLWLMCVTAAAAVLTWWLVWSMRRLIGDWRQLRLERGMEAKLAEQRRLATEAAAREKRIEETLKGAISEKRSFGPNDQDESRRFPAG